MNGYSFFLFALLCGLAAAAVQQENTPKDAQKKPAQARTGMPENVKEFVKKHEHIGKAVAAGKEKINQASDKIEKTMPEVSKNFHKYTGKVSEKINEEVNKHPDWKTMPKGQWAKIEKAAKEANEKYGPAMKDAMKKTSEKMAAIKNNVQSKYPGIKGKMEQAHGAIGNKFNHEKTNKPETAAKKA